MLTRYNSLLSASLPKRAANKSSRIGLGFALGLLAVGGISSASAEDIAWRGGNGDWNSTANWANAANGGTAYNVGGGSFVTFNKTGASNAAQTINFNVSNLFVQGLDFKSTGSTNIVGNGNRTLGIYQGVNVNAGAGAVTIGSGANGNGQNVNVNFNNQGNTITNNSSNGLTFQNNVNVGDWNSATFKGTGNTTINGVLSQGTNTGVGIIKSGSGTLTLNGNNTYKGSTNVTGGTLTVNGNSNAATNTVTVSGAGTALTGNGTIGGNTTLSNGATHSAGGIGTVGLQTFDKAGSATTNLTYGSGSIFSWSLDTALAQTRGIGYDAVNVTGTLAGSLDSVFQVDIGSGSFSDSFWDTAKTWDDIFMGANGVKADWTSIFGGGLGPLNTNGQGSFSFSGNSLSWNPVYSPVPEPTGALAGLLLVAGMLRRRRNA